MSLAIVHSRAKLGVQAPAGQVKIAQRQLKQRRGIQSLVLPNVLDFEQQPLRIDDFNGDFRQAIGLAEDRLFFRGNGVPMVGIGIIKQSTANTIAVADAAKAEMARINPTLPDGMEIKQSYDTSIFVKGAIREVYKTLGIAIGLVVLVIFLFLGSVRAMLVPAVSTTTWSVSTKVQSRRRARAPGNCLSRCRSSYCGCCRRAKFDRSAIQKHTRSMSG